MHSALDFIRVFGPLCKDAKEKKKEKKSFPAASEIDTSEKKKRSWEIEMNFRR